VRNGIRKNSKLYYKLNVLIQYIHIGIKKDVSFFLLFIIMGSHSLPLFDYRSKELIQ